MKILKIAGLFLLAIAFHSCSGEDTATVDDPQNEVPENPDNPDNPDNPGNPGNPDNPGTGGQTGYAMTAKINGALHVMNTPFGNNNASQSISSDYPDEDYIFLQARYGGVVGPKEFDMWIKRSDLIEGATYQVNAETFYTATHIDYINLLDVEYEETVSGHITITELDTTAKHIEGTFEFDTSPEPWAETIIINNHVTEGTFNYDYDVE